MRGGLVWLDSASFPVKKQEERLPSSIKYSFKTSFSPVNLFNHYSNFGDTNDFRLVSAEGVETFPALGAPQLARLVEGAGGDLVPAGAPEGAAERERPREATHQTAACYP